MFNNIGGKIKVLAQVEAWIGIISSVIIGIYLIGQGMDAYDGEIIVMTGVIILVVGSLFSWLSAFVLYGFGELVETNVEIARGTSNSQSVNATANQPIWTCPKCQKPNYPSEISCWACKTPK